MKLIVKGPFFKIRNDGTYGVRVDDPKDVLFGHEVSSPVSFLEWKLEGNKCFGQKFYEEAKKCYSSALKSLVSDQKIIYLILLNLSQCSLKLNDSKEALLFGFVASIIGEKSSLNEDNSLLCKAYHRMNEAALSLKEFGVSELCLQKIKGLDETLWKKQFLFNESNVLLETEEYNARIKKLIDSLTYSLCLFIEFESCQNFDLNADSISLKEKAGECYLKGKYLEAKNLYLSALRNSSFKDHYADILRNMSACFVDDPCNCAALSFVSLCVSPLSNKSLYRLCNAVLQMQFVESASSLCRIGLNASTTTPIFATAFAKLQEKIELTQKSGAKSTGGINFGKNMEKLIEDEVYGKKKNSTLEQTKVFNNILNLANLGSKPSCKDDILSMMTPFNSAFPIHVEYMKTNLLPKHCDRDVCYKILEEAFELAKSYKLHSFGLLHGIIDNEESTLIKRWGDTCTLPNFPQWHAQAKPGSLAYHLFDDTFNSQYLPSLLQSFSNCVYKPDTVDAGSVVVSIGFVDLSSLIYNDLVNNDLQVGKVALKWIGYEMSSYCVAKTLVIADMMKTANPEAVFQVWYSSAWSSLTQAAFLKSVTKILNSGTCRDDEVLQFLSYWLSNTVTLKKSRQLWLSAQNDSAMEILNFKRAIDRNALCSYALSGQLLQGETGSIVMFCNPPGLGFLALEHSFLRTIYFPLLAKHWCNSRTDVIQTGISIVLGRITSWMEHMKSGFVEVVVKRKKIESDPALVNEIRLLKPNLINWSNVPDYILPKEFFSIVKAISIRGTEHRLYSMNWLRVCFGTYALDFPKEQRLELLEKADKYVYSLYSKHGIKSFLTTEIIDNAMNSTMAYLTNCRYLSWSKSLLKIGGVHESCIKFVELQDYNHFHRGPGTVFVAFTLEIGC